MRIPRIDLKDATGLLDKLIGLGKEVVGEVLDRERLIHAGEAQQSKGTEKLKAVREQAKAEAHRAKAEGLRQRQKAAQESKAS